MLAFQFIPYAEIEKLPSDRRIQRILSVVMDDKIAVLEGTLRKEEETELIQRTMESIDERFKGIELAVSTPKKKMNEEWHEKIKGAVINYLLGGRSGFTIIGPATIIKEIKKNPDKIELLTKTINAKRKR
ncbi:MAG: DUF2073 domain-containing protein [Candidatus Woesearchaeota archaeon]|jgi:hypothetical protein